MLGILLGGSAGCGVVHSNDTYHMVALLASKSACNIRYSVFSGQHCAIFGDVGC